MRIREICDNDLNCSFELDNRPARAILLSLVKASPNLPGHPPREGSSHRQVSIPGCIGKCLIRTAPAAIHLRHSSIGFRH